MKHAPVAEHSSPLSASQAEQLNQLAASLTASQSSWVSGYLAGLQAAAGEADASAQPVSAATGAGTAATLTVLYGSQTGNAEDLAVELQTTAQEKGLAVELRDMADYKNKNLKSEQNLAVLVSTHGEGEPPDDAEDLHEFIHGNKAPKLAGVQFAVLALGDTSYDHFCQTGKDFDARLEELGGERVCTRVDCDVDYEDPARSWMQSVVDSLGEQQSQASGETSATVTPLPGAQGAAAGAAPSRQNPYFAPVLSNICLNGRGSSNEVRHIELETEDSGLVWQPGDSLGVMPQNEHEVVDELVATLGLNADETVTGLNGETELYNALVHDYEITTLTRPFVEHYAHLAESQQLNKLLGDDHHEELMEYMYGRFIIDLVEDFPVTGLNANEFVRLLRKLPPRLYSIASSYNANPDEVHLTVAAVRYNTYGRERNGVASIHLADRVGQDGAMPVYVDRNKNFKLPDDPDTPVIMVGPGTGVAPFRAFMEEREEQQAGGKNWLFFGAPHFMTDFYYQTDWLRWRRDGLLNGLDVAFSRDQQEKLYVQHRLLENADALYGWLQEGAHFYVCGDADRMAHDVHDALTRIVMDQGNMNADAAADYLKDLQKSKRYQRDVY